MINENILPSVYFYAIQIWPKVQTDLDGRVPVSEGGSGELVLDGGVHAVRVLRGWCLGDDDAVAGHDLAAEEAGQEVAVHDVLVLAHQDATTFLRERKYSKLRLVHWLIDKKGRND